MLIINYNKSRYLFLKLRLEFSLILVIGLLLSSCSSDSEDSSETGTANLAWNAPTTAINGSCLSNLQGYFVYYGKTPDNYASWQFDNVDVNAESVSCVQTNFSANCADETYSCSYTVRNLGQGEWNFVVQAYDSNGNISGFSNETSKTIY